MDLLITEKIHPKGIRLLEKYFQVDCKFGLSQSKLNNCIKKYDAIVIRAATPVSKEIIDSAIKLKAIGMAGIGLNHIDVNYAKKKGIAIFNVPDGSNQSVAELTLALILVSVRKVNQAIYSTKYKGEWNKHGFIGKELKGKTLGIIALGNIGKRVAKYCQSIGMKVIAYDPYLDLNKAKKLNVNLVELNDLLEKSDIISIHAPLTSDTYHMIGEKEIDKMKTGSYLINTGRGGIIDEESLYDALVNKKLSGAAVDVMEKEPPGKSKLFQLDNFIATPHIGAGTIEAQRYISIEIAKKIIKHFKFRK